MPSISTNESPEKHEKVKVGDAVGADDASSSFLGSEPDSDIQSEGKAFTEESSTDASVRSPLKQPKM
jgi:hypothetical protein